MVIYIKIYLIFFNCIFVNLFYEFNIIIVYKYMYKVKINKLFICIIVVFLVIMVYIIFVVKKIKFKEILKIFIVVF